MLKLFALATHPNKEDPTKTDISYSGNMTLEEALTNVVSLLQIEAAKQAKEEDKPP